ncbi:uncharacterized protein LOC134653583 [Cydia amplana]|uniref:uncharacterized protein LOC134653583 n=1 Tax=Cydia amplana TaxID=1869771 RepID=UPI002FE5696A
MGFRTATALLWLLGATYGKVDVGMTGHWKENVGWQLTCTWTLDSRPLQSVRLYRDDTQFLIYRPEKQGVNYNFGSSANDSRLTVDCHDTGSTGKCQLEHELLTAPMFNTTYKCEVSEEGPRFDMKFAAYTIEVFVPPLHPQMEISSQDSLVNVNCTSAAIPAPRLVWRIGEQRIPENFSSRRWDPTSKLWHSWSVVTMSQGESLVLACDVHFARAGKLIMGQSVEAAVNSAETVLGLNAAFLAAALMALLR